VVSKRDPITERMVQTLMTLTIIELEEHSVPAQGADDILYVYVGNVVVTHDIRRTLRVFNGDICEAVDSIRNFIVEGIIGEPSGSSGAATGATPRARPRLSA
jgi:hypothetical protein